VATTHDAGSERSESTGVAAAFPTRFLPAPEVRELPPEPQHF